MWCPFALFGENNAAACGYISFWLVVAMLHCKGYVGFFVWVSAQPCVFLCALRGSEIPGYWVISNTCTLFHLW